MEQDQLTAFEVFEIAEEVQEDAAEFYNQAAAAIPHESNLFLDLARLAEDCRHTFARLKKEYLHGRTPPVIMDDSVYRGIAALNIFAANVDPAEEFEGLHGKGEILRAVLKKEQEIVNYLTGLRSFLATPADTAVVNRIIAEKNRHLHSIRSVIQG